MTRLYIRDDNHELWFFEDGRIRMLLAEYDEDGNLDEQNGYPASSWEDAVRLLNEEGYITDEEEEDD